MLLPMIRAALLALALLAPPAWAETRVPASQSEITLSFAPVVREAAPAVVNIYARRLVAERRSLFADDPFFRDFFREFAPARPRMQNSLGSGVILSPDGYVVSNHHVVGQATDIRVVLNDRREYSARVVLADAEADLAVLKLEDAEELPHLEIRAGETLEVGELVLAIGNPFGVGQTVSSGIVSGLARSGTATGNARGYFIQTDAPINPGNSGGALVDMKGRLVGINTSILTRSGGSNGIGFAIPAPLVAAFLDQAEAGRERFARPWAGLRGQPVEADLAEALGLEVPRGLLVAELHPESPFARAGIAPGDVILAIDGGEVNGAAGLRYRLSVAGPGREVAVTRLRDGRESEVTVALSPPPERPPRDPVRLGSGSALSGLTLVNVNPAVIAELGLPLRAGGVAVADPGRNGARLGLRRGDVILRVNGREPRTSGEAARLLGRASGWVEVIVRRGERRVALRYRV